MHDFHDITVIGCGTFNTLFTNRVGAINIYNAAAAGTKVQNIRFYNIDLVDSKSDAIRIAKNAGTGITNLVFENVTINGTGKEYPYNNLKNSTALRGYAVIFENAPAGNATYCSLNYSNLGGNVNGTAFSHTLISSFRWTELTGCEQAKVNGIGLSPADTTLAGGASLQLRPSFTPENATNKIVSFSSGNPALASVDYAGLVTSLGKGQATITVTTQDGSFSASSVVNVSSDPVFQYKIKNRWQSTYLYDAGDRVKYSVTSTGNNYLWLLEEKDGVKAIKNVGTGDYMHIENLLGYVECTTPITTSMKSNWNMEDAGDGFVRIKTASNTTDYMHNENLQGQAQYGAIQPAWWSAMWMLEPFAIVSTIENLPMEKTLGIYPNPTHGNFNLTAGNFARREKVIITVFNFAGQAIYSQPALVDESGFVKATISAGKVLSQGNYYVVVKGDSNIAKGKLSVVR